jgi:hypothetical protein
MANKFTLISVQHGVIEDNNQEYASLKVLQEGLDQREGYIGLKVGKFKIKDRIIAQKIVDQVTTLPTTIELTTEIDFGAGDKMVPIVTDFKMLDKKAI